MGKYHASHSVLYLPAVIWWFLMGGLDGFLYQLMLLFFEKMPRGNGICYLWVYVHRNGNRIYVIQKHCPSNLGGLVHFIDTVVCSSYAVHNLCLPAKCLMEYEIKHERSILHLFSMLMRVCCVMDVGPGHLTSVPGSAEQQVNIRCQT